MNRTLLLENLVQTIFYQVFFSKKKQNLQDLDKKQLILDTHIKLFYHFSIGQTTRRGGRPLVPTLFLGLCLITLVDTALIPFFKVIFGLI